MSYTISECQQFVDLNDMKFMAFEQTGCTDCYFDNAILGCCDWIPARQHHLCSESQRLDSRSVIWMRIE